MRSGGRVGASTRAGDPGTVVARSTCMEGARYLRNLSAVQALDGIRVIDMATVIAAPGAARYLADFGADVIKVEPPGGDGTRRMGWRDPRDGDSYMWKLVARGKRTVVLDLKTDPGLAHMRALAAGADVLVENLRPGTLE